MSQINGTSNLSGQPISAGSDHMEQFDMLEICLPPQQTRCQPPPSSMAWPSSLKVSGLPFMFQGWNTVFHKTSEIKNEYPVYRLKDYTLYWTIPIIGCFIYFNGNTWFLQRRDGFVTPWEKQNSTDPTGEWTDGMYVTAL